MKLNYNNYTLEDFCQDESFRQWVLNPDPPNKTFWNNWIVENPESAEKINSARILLLTLHEKDIALSDDELTVITNKIIKEKIVKMPFWKNQIFRVAASVAIILGLGLVSIKFFSEQRKTAFFERISPGLVANFIETENHETQIMNIVLEDSSIITLYPKSKIRYPKQFSAEAREVYLEGQAFFTIAKNPKRPFWVYTNYISTQVLGTSFMVKAFDDEKNVKVEVRSGRVSVYRHEDLEKAKLQKKNELAGIILTPNQSIEYSISDARLLKSISRQPEILTNGSIESFVFEEAPISKVFAQLEKAYGIQIIYDEKNMENCYLTATFADESLYEKLNLICKVTHSSYEIVDAQIVIHSAGC